MYRRLAVAAVAALLGACSQPSAALSEEALRARGQYLVEGVVLCGDCHTPRVAPDSFEPDLSRRLHGAPTPGPPQLAQFAPPIAGGPANYTQAQFVAFLQNGVRPDGTMPRPPMPAYRLNEDDARAVAAYIASLPAAPQ